MKRLTTRRLFAAVSLTALAGVTVLGGVFAWRTADSARGAAVVGANGFEIEYRPICDSDAIAPADPETGEAIPCLTLIGWNGQSTTVGEGWGKNNGDFPLTVVGGRVAIRGLLETAATGPEPTAIDEDSLDDDTEARRCSVDDFSGGVRIANPGEIIRPGGEGGKFAASLKVHEDAPSSCQGVIVLYRVTIVAENPSVSAADVLDGVR